jgi:Zn-dependent alcohol dehydrogenase
VVFDVVGRAATFEQGLSLLRTEGTYVLIGLSPSGETGRVELPKLFARRARVLVSHGGDHLPEADFPRLAQWAIEGRIDLASMVSRVLPLSEWADGFAAMRDGGVIRTVLTP